MIETRKAPKRAPLCISRPDLIAKAEVLQERGRLRILRIRIRCLRSGHGRGLFAYVQFLLPNPCAMMSLRTDLRACILYGVYPPLLLRGPRLRRAVLRHPYRRSLRGRGLFPRVFFGCPCLELLE